MKTQAEIQTKLDQLLAEVGDFHDPRQRVELALQIDTLRWVLGTGPDEILVPRPYAVTAGGAV